MRIVQIKLRNFLSFKELTHSFRDEPVLIQGKNLTEIESKETNGTGKSTLESGIAYAIMANSLRKGVLDKDLIMWGEDTAEISLDIYCPIRKQTLNIHRILKQKGSSVLELTLDGVKGSVQFSTVNDGNNYILNWIGISSEDLKSFYILNKENYKSFVLSSNSDKLSLINRFIKADALDGSDDLVKEKVKPLQEKRLRVASEASMIEGKLSVYREQLEEELGRDIEGEKQALIDKKNDRLNEIALLIERKLDEEAKFRKEISMNEEEIEKKRCTLELLKKEVENLSKKSFASEYKEVQDQRSEVDSEIQNARKEYMKVNTATHTLANEISRLKLIIDGAIHCPHCGYEFSIQEPEKDIDEYRQDVVKKETEATRKKEALKECQETIDSLSESLAIFEEATSEIREKENALNTELSEVRRKVISVESEIGLKANRIAFLENSISTNEKSCASLEEEALEISKQLDELNERGLETKVEEFEGLISVLEKKLEKTNSQLQAVDLEISDIIQWGVRLKEFKMSLACEQLKVIQGYANKSLESQNSELRLSIDGFKKNAKGEVKAEITVSVINGSGEVKSFFSYSGGERARVEVALIQAFQEMINGTNPWGGLDFLMIDEVLEGTDPLGLALLMESLKDQQKAIYVISHIMNIRSGIQTMTIVKENGQSYIENE